MKLEISHSEIKAKFGMPISFRWVHAMITKLQCFIHNGFICESDVATFTSGDSFITKKTKVAQSAE